MKILLHCLVFICKTPKFYNTQSLFSKHRQCVYRIIKYSTIGSDHSYVMSCMDTQSFCVSAQLVDSVSKWPTLHSSNGEALVATCFLIETCSWSHFNISAIRPYNEVICSMGFVGLSSESEISFSSSKIGCHATGQNAAKCLEHF